MKTIRNTLLGIGAAILIGGTFYKSAEYANDAYPRKRADEIVSQAHKIGNEKRASQRYFALDSLTERVEMLLNDSELSAGARKTLSNAYNVARAHTKFAKTNSYDTLPCCVNAKRP